MHCESEKMNDITVEARLRRRLKKHGFYLSKTTARSWTRDEYGVGYMIFETYTNTCIYGYWHRKWQATLEQIEEFVRDLEAEASRNG